VGELHQAEQRGVLFLRGQQLVDDVIENLLGNFDVKVRPGALEIGELRFHQVVEKRLQWPVHRITCRVRLSVRQGPLAWIVGAVRSSCK
jgi:hypothetical protein